MSKVMCSIHDECSGVWSPPMCVVNQASAVRSVADAMRDVNDFSRHPEHFNLYVVGTFDDDDGTVVGHAPEHVIALVNLVKEG